MSEFSHRDEEFPHIWADTDAVEHCDRCGAVTTPPDPHTSTDIDGDIVRLIEGSREFRARHRYCRREDMRP